MCCRGIVCVLVIFCVIVVFCWFYKEMVVSCVVVGVFDMFFFMCCLVVFLCCREC